MSIDNSALGLLEGGGASFKFDTIGKTAKGTVVAATAQQQTDFQSGKPLTWDDGNPRMQLVITLATDERDPDDPTDDGERRIFAKGEMLKAIKAALRAANAELAEGGTLAVKYTGDGEAERGKNPPKLYAAEYKAPSGVDSSAASLI
jgi:hypothetical protein